ncbi:Zinc-finger homeodomain protein [Salix suchowensis]|nr:Zinc-finger homeodomain protein [Salix suchowensis]
MNESSLQKDMPISRNGSYEGGNGHSHSAAAAAAQVPTNGHSPSSQQEDERPYKKVVRYKECLKNHAAVLFIPGGEEGSLEALKCSACNCHRNFHRKEMDGEWYPASSFISSRAPPPHQVVVSYKNGGANAITSESDEKEEDNGGGLLTTRPVEKLKKRFRTKFTEEQKQKMLNFAEKAGWKMQKLEESAVQGLCQELGIKRRVLKVWMHNNKHNYVKNSTSS